MEYFKNFMDGSYTNEELSEHSLVYACAGYFNEAEYRDTVKSLSILYDYYMKKSEKYKNCYDKYKKIAANIIRGINLSSKKHIYFGYIRAITNYCAKLVSINELDAALKQFKLLIRNLCEEMQIQLI